MSNTIKLINILINISKRLKTHTQYKSVKTILVS